MNKWYEDEMRVTTWVRGKYFGQMRTLPRQGGRGDEFYLEIHREEIQLISNYNELSTLA